MTEQIKMTNEEIEKMMLNPATAEAVKQTLPAKSSYWIGRAFDKVEQLWKPFYKEVMAITERLTEKVVDEKTKKETVKLLNGRPVWGENQELAEKELADLRAVEHDLGIDKIEIDFDRCDELGIMMAPETSMVLKPFLKL